MIKVKETFQTHLKNESGIINLGLDKLPMYCVLLTYIAFSAINLSNYLLKDLLYILFFITIHLILEYVTNNWGDLGSEINKRQPNIFKNMSYFSSMFLFIFLLTVSVLSGLHFIYKPYFVIIWIIWTFIIAAYSLKPFRLKEKGFISIIFLTLAQWTLPTILIFTAVNQINDYNLLLFVIAFSIRGMTREIGFQRNERIYNLFSTTKTFALKTNPKKLDQLYKTLLFFDKLLLGIITFIFITIINNQFNITIIILLLVFYIILFIFSYIEIRKAIIKYQLLDPYFSSQKNVNKFLHKTYPNLILPTLLLILLSIQYPVTIAFLILFLIWQLIFGQAQLEKLVRIICPMY